MLAVAEGSSWVWRMFKDTTDLVYYRGRLSCLERSALSPRGCQGDSYHTGSCEAAWPAASRHHLSNHPKKPNKKPMYPDAFRYTRASFRSLLNLLHISVHMQKWTRKVSDPRNADAVYHNLFPFTGFFTQKFCIYIYIIIL